MCVKYYILNFIIGDTGSIQWTSNSVTLTSSTVPECKEVVRQLKRQQHTTWSVELISLSSDSLLTLLANINDCLVRRLYIYNTLIDSHCVSEMVQVVNFNKTMEELHLTFSPLLPNIYYLLTTAISYNNTLKILRISYDNNINDRDIPHICNVITTNKTLKSLYFTHCPRITKFGIQQIQKAFVNNKSLDVLYINGNWLRHY